MFYLFFFLSNHAFIGMSQSAEIKFRQASEAGHDDLDFSAIHTSKKVKK